MVKKKKRLMKLEISKKKMKRKKKKIKNQVIKIIFKQKILENETPENKGEYKKDNVEVKKTEITVLDKKENETETIKKNIKKIMFKQEKLK